MFNFFKKRKKVITLNQFALAIEKVAKDFKESYWQVTIEYSPHGSTHNEMRHVKGIVLGGYINKHGHQYGVSIEEVVQKFRTPKPEVKESLVTDVELTF